MTGVSKRRVRTAAAGAHGFRRATDRATASGTETTSDAQPRPLRAPLGASWLLGSLAVALGAVGIARVHASTRVLEIGAEITELAGEHAQLLEQRRRLRAERAYLRHPNQIRAAAREELGFVPISPGLVQRIRLIEETDRP